MHSSEDLPEGLNPEPCEKKLNQVIIVNITILLKITSRSLAQVHNNNKIIIIIKLI